MVSRRQLLDAGVTEKAIEHRLRRKRIRLLYAGVYAVGLLRPSRYARWMAAVLACGEGAILSYLSAAVLMGMLRWEGKSIHVSKPSRRSSRQPGIKVHRPTCLPLEDRHRFDGIPVTSPTRTLIDLAATLDESDLESALSEAVIRDRVEIEPLRRELDRRLGQRGVRPLRDLIDRHTFKLIRSDLERRFLRIARRAGLPEPETMARVDGFEVDFLFRGLGIVVETDGGRFHRSAVKQTRDREREHAHLRAGRLPLRFTHHQIARRADSVAETLQAVASPRLLNAG